MTLGAFRCEQHADDSPDSGDVDTCDRMDTAGMQWRKVDSPDLTWDALSSWICAWDPFLGRGDLGVWAVGLRDASVVVDSAILWAPETNMVVAPVGRSVAHLEQCMRRAISSFAGISPRHDGPEHPGS